MAAYEMTGAVKVVMDEVTFPSGFNKREFVVTTEDDRYPQDIKFETVKEKTALLTLLTQKTFDLCKVAHEYSVTQVARGAVVHEESSSALRRDWTEASQAFEQSHRESGC